MAAIQLLQLLQLLSHPLVDLRLLSELLLNAQSQLQRSHLNQHITVVLL